MTYIDLSGKWDAFIDEDKRDSLPQSYDAQISLPDTTSNARMGKKNTEKSYGCLTDLYKFEGYAWFRRTFSLTERQAAEHTTLFLERTRKTAVYIDGEKLGEYCSLCAPHRYTLDGLSAGEHELVIRVDNTDYPTAGGHLTSPDTQTNWNGITGRIGIYCFSAYPEAIRIIPDTEKGSVAVFAEISGEKSGTAALTVFDENGEYGSCKADFSDGLLSCEIPLRESYPLWSEFSPNLLRLKIEIGSDARIVSFGMRRLSADGLKLKINGCETFLRGKHDGLVFPKTGYAPTDTESWSKVFETAKQYGINHYRFHTCCPPEAAFEAADMAGIYLQPELPFWGTIPDELNAEHEFLKSEGYRILREYGHHPSFVMMSLGNELWGSKERLDEILSEYKAAAPDKLFVQGSNNYQFVPCVLEHDDFFSGVRFDRDRLIRGSYASCDAPFGHIQTDEPNSVHSYNGAILPASVSGGSEGGDILIQYGTEMKKVSAGASDALVPNVPVVSHEVGQYCIYPDYDEIPRYTGSLRHDTYEGYRAEAEKKGLLPYWRDFFKASGALAVDCYRREIETAMRSGLMSGFQLLDLQDFPGQGTATVGILNAFMESKGLTEPNEWRKFCGSSVVLAELERFIYTSGEEITAGLLVSTTEPGFKADKINWSVKIGGKETAGGSVRIVNRDGRIHRAEPISFRAECNSPTTATLEISAGAVTNSYTLYIYPEIDVKITENEIICGGRRLPVVHSPEDANGHNLCIPLLGEKSLRGEYCTDFWCYGMFKSISESMGKPVPTGTLGLLINSDSPLLGGFPSESHTTPPWYAIVTHSRCADLDGTGIVPDVWVIDNPLRASRLALLYRDGGRTFCTSRLWEAADRIEVKHFAASLLNAIL